MLRICIILVLFLKSTLALATSCASGCCTVSPNSTTCWGLGASAVCWQVGGPWIQSKNCNNATACEPTASYACAGGSAPAVNMACAYVQITAGTISSYWSDSGCSITSCGGTPELSNASELWSSLVHVFDLIKGKRRPS